MASVANLLNNDDHAQTLLLKLGESAKNPQAIGVRAGVAMINRHQRKAVPFVGPIYLQVRDLIREQIERSNWAPGTPLPGELDMARSFDVSVGTMRKALSMLVDEGLVRRQRGRGTFVEMPRQNNRRLPFGGVSADSGEHPPIALKECFSTAPTPDEAANLQLAHGDNVQVLVRIAAKLPAYSYLERIVVPIWLFARIGDGPHLDHTLFDLYERRGRTPVDCVTKHIQIATADASLAGILNCRRGTRLLRVERTAFDKNGVPVEFCVKQMYLRDENYVVRFPAGGPGSFDILSS